jgi:hypothetical protein
MVFRGNIFGIPAMGETSSGPRQKLMISGEVRLSCTVPCNRGKQT